MQILIFGIKISISANKIETQKFSLSPQTTSAHFQRLFNPNQSLLIPTHETGAEYSAAVIN